MHSRCFIEKQFIMKYAQSFDQTGQNSKNVSATPSVKLNKTVQRIQILGHLLESFNFT